MKTNAYTPFEVGARDRLVGVFVIVALLLFLLGFLLPRFQQLGASEGMAFYTHLDKTYGIAPEAPISLHGVLIGKVTTIDITDEGGVEIHFLLQSEYRAFYRLGSRLELDSNLAVSTLLKGTGLIYIPGEQGATPLGVNSEIQTVTPKDLSTIVDQLSDPQLVEKLVAIVDHIENLTGGLAENQVKVYDSLDNLKTITNDVSEVTREFPALLASMEASMSELERTMANVSRITSNADIELQQTLKNTVVMTEQASESLAQMTILMQQSQPVVQQLPATLATLEGALGSINRLSEQLQHSWLLGGGGEKDEPVGQGSAFSPHPHDDSLYPAAP